MWSGTSAKPATPRTKSCISNWRMRQLDGEILQEGPLGHPLDEEVVV